MKLAIGSKIKILRKQQRICQQDICGELINRTVLSKIENEKMYPSIPQLIYISEKLKVPINYFFEEEASINKNDLSVNYSSVLQELYNDQRYGDILKIYESEYEKFRVLEDFNKYFYLGISFFETNLRKQAQKYFKKYISQYMKAFNDTKRQHLSNFVIALNYLFLVMYESTNYSKAEHYLIMAKKYLKFFSEEKSRQSYMIYNNLGILYNDSCQYEKTIKTLEVFLHENYDNCYLEFLAHMHLSLNIAYYNLGNYKKSIEHIKNSIFFYNYIGDMYAAMDSNLNLINAFRYDNNFRYALITLNEIKEKVPNLQTDFPQFLVQEMIILFNMHNYNKVLEISQNINIKKLSKITKANFNFILGHINFLNNKYALAYKQLLKCEKSFIKENYSYDLITVYNDLYTITDNEMYKNKIQDYSKIRGRKNIVV